VKLEILTRRKISVPIIALVRGMVGAIFPPTLSLVLVIPVLLAIVLDTVKNSEVVAERVGRPDRN